MAEAQTVSTENVAKDVRAEDAFDVAAVDKVLKEAVPGLEGSPTVKQFPAGASNLTYLLAYKNRDLVLRRPPAGKRPKSGHSMIREYTIIKGLKPVYPAVPEALYYADDASSVLGVEFYVMEKVDGHLLGPKIPPAWSWSPDDTRRFCEGFWDKLVELHAVDYEKAGLGDFGKPQGYVERQVLGWNQRYENAFTEDADPFEDVRDWLDANRPKTETGAAILHGDFRIDNCILAPDDPFKIKAVLDWEISALGDPLMDLGACLIYWIEADDPPHLQILLKQPSAEPGMMSRKEIIAYYAEKSGRAIGDMAFYQAYGAFRLAVIAQQIYYRWFHKQTTNPVFEYYGQGARAYGDWARTIIREGVK